MNDGCQSCLQFLPHPCHTCQTLDVKLGASNIFLFMCVCVSLNTLTSAIHSTRYSSIKLLKYWSRNSRPGPRNAKSWRCISLFVICATWRKNHRSDCQGSIKTYYKTFQNLLDVHQSCVHVNERIEIKNVVLALISCTCNCIGMCTFQLMHWGIQASSSKHAESIT